MHPVPQGLTVHAAGFGRRFAVNAIEHQRKRKYPTRRRTIFLSARRLAKLRSRQIKLGDRYRRSHRCRSSQRTASSQSFTDLGIPNESQFRATGIITSSHKRDATRIGSASWLGGTPKRSERGGLANCKQIRSLAYVGGASR